jgi:hypothetical protein
MRNATIAASLLMLVAGVMLLAPLGCIQSDEPAAVAKVEPSASVPAEKQTPEQMRDRLDSAIDFIRTQRHLNSKEHSAWQVVHGILPYGRAFEIKHEDKLVSALDYLLAGGKLNGWNMRRGDHGVQTILEAGSKTGQGHEDQWLGYLSQCGLKLDDRIVVEGESFTIADLVEQAKWNIHEGQEATWTLMAASTYLPDDATWTAKDGTEWTIERMAKMEAGQDLNGSACGGTHRLYALVNALNRHIQQGGEITGGWIDVKAKIDGSFAKVKEYQNPDGSFSAQFFTRASKANELSGELHSTGHTLEVLAAGLSDQDLRQPYMTRAVNHLLDLLDRTKDLPLECGALYHAARGLMLYRDRLYGVRDYSQPATPVAAADSAASES